MNSSDNIIARFVDSDKKEIGNISIKKIDELSDNPDLIPGEAKIVYICRKGSTDTLTFVRNRRGEIKEIIFEPDRVGRTCPI